jgi:hypothetical protein
VSYFPLFLTIKNRLQTNFEATYEEMKFQLIGGFLLLMVFEIARIMFFLDFKFLH